MPVQRQYSFFVASEGGVPKVTFDYDFCLDLNNQCVIARSLKGDVANPGRTSFVLKFTA
jgi:hypothetical protein